MTRQKVNATIAFFHLRLADQLPPKPCHRPRNPQDCVSLAFYLSRFSLLPAVQTPFLLTPGPVTVPDFVLDAMRRPVMHHRDAPFKDFFQGLQARLRGLFLTESITGVFAGSGTYGVEMMMRSLLHRGERVLVLNLGKFSERWARYGQLMGLQVLEVQAPWGASISLEQVQTIARDQSNLGGVVITHSETSTGTMVDLEEMAFVLRRAHPDILILVDAITSVGAMPYYHDDWGIDATIVASQKALLNPAGLVAYALSSRAEARLWPTFGGDFANLRNYAAHARQSSFPFTPPLSLMYGLDAALARIEQETLPVVWQRVHESARIFRQGLAELGGKVRSEMPSESLTAFTLPGADLQQVRQRLAEAHGLLLAGGQGNWKGEVLRVSHMGEADASMMQRLLMAMNEVLG